MNQNEAPAQSDQTAEGEAQAAPASDGIQNNDTQEAGNTGLADSGEVENNPTSSMAERIEGADGVEEYEALMGEFDSMADEPEEYAEPQQDQEVPEAGGQAPAEESELGEPVGGEGVTEPEDSDKHPQFRLRPSDNLDAEAFRIYKAAKTADADITMVDAIEIARQRLGIPAGRTDSTQNPPQDLEGFEDQGDTEEEYDPTDDVTHAEAKAELKSLRKQQSEALRNGDLDEAADFGDAMSDTEDLMEVLSEREESNANEAQESHDTGFQAALDRATELYPDFEKPESEFWDRCAEIDAALRDTGDSRYFDVDKPLTIAQMAAKELQVAPGRRGTTGSARPPQQISTSSQSARTEKPTPMPAASGASRTSGPPAGAAASLTEQISTVNSADDYDDLAERLSASL